MGVWGGVCAQEAGEAPPRDMFTALRENSNSQGYFGNLMCTLGLPLFIPSDCAARQVNARHCGSAAQCNLPIKATSFTGSTYAPKQAWAPCLGFQVSLTICSLHK